MKHTYHKNYKGNFITSHIRESMDFDKGEALAWIVVVALLALAVYYIF
jgi:hypothetical protein